MDSAIAIFLGQHVVAGLEQGKVGGVGGGHATGKGNGLVPGVKFRQHFLQLLMVGGVAQTGIDGKVRWMIRFKGDGLLEGPDQPASDAKPCASMLQ